MTASKIYQYGCRPPTDWGPDMDEHFQLQHSTYNRLIEIHRAARAEEYAFIASLDPVLQETAVKIEALREKMSAAYAAGDRDEAGRIGATMAVIFDEVRPIRRQMYRSDAFRDWKPLAKARKREAIKALYNEPYDAKPDMTIAQRLHWGTFNALAKRAEQAAQMTVGTAHMPKFRRFTGMPLGIYQQIQKGTSLDGEGLTVEELEQGGHSQIGILPGRALPGQDAVGSKYRTLRIKVYGDRYLHLPMIYHRPLPDGCRVKEVHVIRTMIGRKKQWSANFVLTMMPAQRLISRADDMDATAGIAIDWTDASCPIRTASYVNLSAAEDVMTASMWRVAGALDRVKELQSTRDRLRNEILPVFRGIAVDSVPEPLRELWERTMRGRQPSPLMLAPLVLAWGHDHHNFAPQALKTAEEWRVIDARLYETQSHLHAQALACRRNAYRCLARTIVDSHSTIAVSAIDLAAAAVGRDDGTKRVRAALSEFVADLKWMAADEGVTMLSLPMAKATDLRAAARERSCGTAPEIEEKKVTKGVWGWKRQHSRHTEKMNASQNDA